MPKRLTWSIAGFALVVLVGLVGSARVGGRVLAADTRTVYVSVTDKSGAAVTDMQAADFEVKAGGKTAEIVSVKPATAPLRIAIIDSDAGTGGYQVGLQHFMEKLLGKAEFALTSVIIQPQRVSDYSGDAAVLSKGLEALGRRGNNQRGAQLMEAIAEAAKDVRAEGKRSVILVARVGGEATSTLTGKDVRAQLQKSGATLFAISVPGVDRPTTTGGGGTGAGVGMSAATQQSQLRDDETNTGATNLQEVLGDGSKESGGHYDQVVSVTMVKTFEQLGDELLHQYEVQYVVPAGVKPDDKLAVASKRKTATARAPARMN